MKVELGFRTGQPIVSIKCLDGISCYVSGL